MSGNKINHPWHGIHYGSDAPEIVNAIIEIPKGSRAKYEIDKESGLIKLDRVLYSSVHYPANYGFIPRSYGDDKDPLDILVLSQVDMPPLCLVTAQVIGVMRMTDAGEIDDKIIAVAHQDVAVNHIMDISELPPHTMKEIRQFFEDYKTLENKKVVVLEFLPREDALRIIEEALVLYQSTFGKELT